MYIYESHMGGLYVLDEQVDFDFLYCEECGDWDSEIGYAETRAEAWDLLKERTDTFDESLCKKCAHEGDYEYCDFECENFSHSGGYLLSYVQEFIDEHWSE